MLDRSDMETTPACAYQQWSLGVDCWESPSIPQVFTSGMPAIGQKQGPLYWSYSTPSRSEGQSPCCPLYSTMQ